MICSAAILGDHERALAALGVDHYLTKPYHPEDLIAHVAEEIGRHGPSAVLSPRLPFDLSPERPNRQAPTAEPRAGKASDLRLI